MSAPQRAREGFRAWLPVIGLAFAAFVFNTSEFLPVGLLPDMAASLDETVSFMGLVITGYAWVVSIMSLPLALATAKYERRKLLLFLLAVFAACHFVVIWVDSFATLYAARVGVALTHSVFWSIMTPLAARMAPAGRRAVGLAAVMGGTIVATVLGVPIGTKLGHIFGWAESFFIIGIAAAAVLVLLWLVLPECPSTRAGSIKSLPVILKRPALLQLYGLTMITVLGQFTAYSYISPILVHAGGLDESAVVNVLLVYGLAGIIGTVVSSKTVDRFPSGSLTVPLVLLALCLYALVPLAGSWGTLVPLILVWGAAQTAICMAFQTVVLNVAADAADVATSLYSGIFNIGIGGGAFVGSLVSEHFGFFPVSFTGGAFVTASAIFTIAVFLKTGSAILPHEDLSRAPGTESPAGKSA
ncbi:sugar transporter [Sutterella sp.]|uniref:sugar transporter n=1 Tax=Sutterella sp. TaxID=1981025 RepID=UPI0026DFB266|nr:sugar transporter [Sutterella sp.]MDO5532791.1 sugar transporter [Sutterella sp.]